MPTLDLKGLFAAGMDRGDRDPGDDDRLKAAKAMMRAIRDGVRATRPDDVDSAAEALDLALEDHYRACEESKGDDDEDREPDADEAGDRSEDSDYDSGSSYSEYGMGRSGRR